MGSLLHDRPKPITLDGTVLPLWDHTIEKTTSFTWMAPRMRSYVAWRLSEQYWRFSLEHLDTFLISIGHVRTTDARTDRHAKVAAAFGGGTYVPRTNNPLVAATWSERVDAVLRFHDIVNSWPCMSIPIPDGVRTEEEIFTEFERAVHGAFAETYRDYYCRPAPVLYHRPSGLDVPTAIPIPKFC
ncbi:hypothetical protein BKA62DRAFT_767712 [Auriculariales sp. MPI-PUGE-AT-0066]|nr:hypothetical protein BKA62DRAFT_767712 [Auriculariales sp. MPI-PUGE-AT-0066]